MLSWLLVGCPTTETPECDTYDEVFVWADGDGDGFGRDEPIGYACAPGPNQATNKVDCDDENPDVNPGTVESCDLLDNDCNGVVDDGFPKLPWYEDADGDGIGTFETQTTAQCLPPAGTWVNIAGDCDDADPAVNPLAIEVCNGFDDDCDGLADDDDPGVDPTSYEQWHPDLDLDGFGDNAFVVDACAPPVPGAITDGTDCDDDDPDIRPDAPEVCDLVDNDCDDLIDDADPSIDPASQNEYFADADADGYGDPLIMALACRPTAGSGVDNDLDCDDADPLVNVPQDWYFDEDGDGWGVPPSLGFSCFPPGPDTGPFLGDCEETDPAFNPGAIEDCFDGIDQNCNGDLDCDDADCASEPSCIQPCADVVASGPLPLTLTGSTAGAGNDFNPTCAPSTSADVVVQWVAPATQIYTIDLAGSSFDTVLHVRDGCAGAQIACNDDFFGLQSRVQVSAVAGQVLIIVIDGYAAATGNYVLNIN